MRDVLIYGDTLRSLEMRHELALRAPDPCLYAKLSGQRHVVATSLEGPQITALDGSLVFHPQEEFGFDELLAAGVGRHEADIEIAVSACRTLGVRNVRVPGEFPLELADRLRASGIEVIADQPLFDSRRRVKSLDEIAGIRRAQATAEAGMRAAKELLHAAEPGDGGLLAAGQPLTCERVKQAMRDAIEHAGANPGDDFIVSHGAQSAVGHNNGSGRIQPQEPVIIDVSPRDRLSACFADMTRTFVVGNVPGELRRYHELTRESLQRSLAAVRAGASATMPFGLAASPMSGPVSRHSAPNNPGRCSIKASTTRWAHGVGLGCTRRRTSAAPRTCWSPGM